MSGPKVEGIIQPGAGYCDDCVEQDGDGVKTRSDPCFGHQVWLFDLDEPVRRADANPDGRWLCGVHIHRRMLAAKRASTSANVTIGDDGEAIADGFTFQF